MHESRLGERPPGGSSNSLGHAVRRCLPLLVVALATLGVLAAVSERLANWLLPDSATTISSCLIWNDPHTGLRGVPGSSCLDKTYEGPLIDYRFNDCGFRTPQPCQPAAAGLYRIVMIGSSFNFGLSVNQSESFASLLGPILSQRLHRPVDVFNESMYRGFPAVWALRTDTLLQPRPSMILWPLTEIDLQVTTVLQPPVASSVAAPKNTNFLVSAWRKFIERVSNTHLAFMLQHYLYGSESQYLGHSLTQGPKVDYLQVPTPASLRVKLAMFKISLHAVAAHARAAKVPLVVTLLPTRAQAIMLSNHAWDTGFDPNQLGRLLRPIVEAEGGRYIDMMSGVGSNPDAGKNYFAVDEHPTPAGHRMLANLLGDALVRSGTLVAATNARR